MRRVISLPDSQLASFTLLNTAKVRPWSMTCVIRTDATVGNRWYSLRVLDKVGITKLLLPVSVALVASGTYSITFARGSDAASLGYVIQQSLPDIELEIDDVVIFDDLASISSAGDKVEEVVVVADVLEA